MAKEKVLIIKLGYSETLDNGVSNSSSLGDVLRTTVLLHLYKKAEVKWLVDEAAAPLLVGNPHIHQILPYNMTSVLQLQTEHFDTVINLEKVPGICALADSINAWRRFGFRFHSQSGKVMSYDGSHQVLTICSNIKLKRQNGKYWQEALFEIVEQKWNGEKYVLGYRPHSKVVHDIGLNHKVGSKWPTKAWPITKWKSLHDTLTKKGYSVSWQQGLNDLYEYMEWINSCRTIVTNDSLGLHIAQALGKKVVALYGPTVATEVYMYGQGKALTPDCQCEHMPCLSPSCKEKTPCMEFITVESVAFALEEIATSRRSVQVNLSESGSRVSRANQVAI